MADLGTEKLSHGLAERDPNNKAYVPTGEDKFNLYMLEKYIHGRSMKLVRQAFLSSLSTGVAILSLQPVIDSSRVDEMT